MPKNYLENALAIAGSEDLILGFKALGFNTYALKGPDEFKSIIPEIIQKGIAVCLVEEEIFAACDDEISKYQNSALPIFIPFAKGAQAKSLDKIVRDIKLKATGVIQ